MKEVWRGLKTIGKGIAKFFGILLEILDFVSELT